MAGQRGVVKGDDGEPRRVPSAAERKGKRAHDANGNVRPADGRWDLHDPKDEAKHVRSSSAKRSAR